MGEQERNALAAVGPDGDSLESGGRERSMPSRRTFALTWTPGRSPAAGDGQNVAHVVVASYRRWAIESALIDLARRQTGLACVDPLAPDGA